MPPILALIICTIFVLYLLRLDRKQTTDVSFALWIPTIWMLLIASRPLIMWFGAEADAEGSPLDRAVLSGLLILGLTILTWRRFRWLSTLKDNIWLIVLLGYMLLSILWSDIPYTSFKRWIREITALVMAFVVLSERDPRKATESVLRRSIYILIPFSLLLIKYFPEYGVQYGRWSGGLMWIGVTLQKNGLGRLCLIAAFFLIWSIIRRWQNKDTPVSVFQTYADVFVLFIALWLLKGAENAYSATAVTSFVLVMAMYFILLRMKKRKIYFGANALTAIMALIIGFGVVTPLVGGVTMDGVASSLGRDETMTGRTEIWADLLPVVKQQPFFGRGFGGFWTPEARQEHDAGEAHSGYMDVLLELGFSGMLLFATYLLTFCRKAQREMAHDYDWANLCICLLLMALLHNVTETSINSFASQLTAVLLFLSISSTVTTSHTP